MRDGKCAVENARWKMRGGKCANSAFSTYTRFMRPDFKGDLYVPFTKGDYPVYKGDMCGLHIFHRVFVSDWKRAQLAEDAHLRIFRPLHPHFISSNILDL
jgi:hypothetical protein